MIAECLLIKNENSILIEHLTLNIQSGIEFFYIYDNNSTISVIDFLKSNAPHLLKYCKIENIQASQNLQLDCYAKCINDNADVDWIAFIDTDELFVGNIKDVIDKYSKCSCISFSSVLHGCNGFIKHQSGRMSDLYRNDIIRISDWTKTIVRPKAVKFQDVHFSILKPNHYYHYLSSRSCSTVLHHYRFRSLEDWIIKIKRGTCDNRARFKIAEFFKYNTGVKLDNPDVIELLNRYNVNLDTSQNYE